MNWWTRIKRYFYKKKLAEQVAAQGSVRSITNLQHARHVGIIYDSSLPENDVTIGNFAEQLRSQGKTVEVLGFINDNKIERKDGLNVFNKKNLSWTGVPVTEKAEKFAGTGFDILLACFTGENLPLEFIAGTSKAKYRVGCYTEGKTDCYDLMVNVGGRHDLQYLIDQQVFFLNEIKYDSK